MTENLAIDNSVVVNQVIVLFLLMVTGFIIKKRGILTAPVIKGFSSFLLNVTLPAMVITAFHMEFSLEMLRDVGVLFLIASALHFLSLAGSKFLFRGYPPEIDKVLRFVTVFSNCGFMGFPIFASIYGQTGVLYGSIYVMVFNLFLWTAGVTLFTGVKDGERIKTFLAALKNPGIVAVGIGLLVFIFSPPIPEPVFRTLDLLGSMTTPLSMIIVGSLLADLKLKEVFTGFSLYYASFIRLIFLPLFTMGLLYLFGFRGLVLQIMVIAVAMPAAATTVIFTEKYGGDSEYASRVVFISTILSMLTIPVMLLIVQGLAG